MIAVADWRETATGPEPWTRERAPRRAVWAPQPGAQQIFLECPIYEALLEGNRGGGKTDALIFDFCQFVGRGFGHAWRGIIFRKTYKQLEDVIAKTKKWFPRIWPLAGWNEMEKRWTWPGGETLRLAYMERPEDYWNYHGHEFPWQGWEELTTWADDKCYRTMMMCCRSPHPDVPRRIRATTNPYGPGHNWVKARFSLPVAPGRRFSRIFEDPQRVAIHCDLDENRILLTSEPHYRARIAASATSPAQLKAWLEGDWNVVAGGMFDDLWVPRFHVIPNLRPADIPPGWRRDRSYDHGQSKPFSVGWWVESNGEPIVLPSGRALGQVRGDLVRFSEWYGWNGQPNEGVRMLAGEIASEIRRRETEWGMGFRPGPADSAIFDDYEPGKSIAGDMRKLGIAWDAADKRPGSRKQGWEQIRKFLAGAIPGPAGVRENPGLFITEGCEQFLRTIPVLSRSTKDPDDADTEAEDHIADEVRYRVRGKRRDIIRGDI